MTWTRMVAQCCACLTEVIASTPEGQARLDKLTEKENRHLAEHLRQRAEGDPALAQGGMEAIGNASQRQKQRPLSLIGCRSLRPS